MTKSIIQWHKNVTDTYGDLSSFRDKTTIAILHERCIEYLKKDDQTRIALSDYPDALADWVNQTTVERQKVEAIKDELETWIRAKNAT